ncbi:MAG: hypothetical protein ACI91G_000748 [Gammaproteobacteria bacterium]|jgi:hypothetical protein
MNITVKPVSNDGYTFHPRQRSELAVDSIGQRIGILVTK